MLISSLSATSDRNPFQTDVKNSRGDCEWQAAGGWVGSRASAGSLRVLSLSPSLGSVSCHWLFCLAGGFSSCGGKDGLIYVLLA